MVTATTRKPWHHMDDAEFDRLMAHMLRLEMLGAVKVGEARRQLLASRLAEQDITESGARH